VLFAFDRPDLGVPAIVATAVMVYFNSCIQDWWGSAGFGGRRFDGALPFFCLGLAALMDAGARAVRRHALAAVAAVLAMMSIWNLALIEAAHGGAAPIGETMEFDRAWALQARVVHGWFGNPFTYPASLVFALRNGVGPGDYDLLSTNRFLSDPLKPYGRIDIGTGDEWAIEEGWHAAESEGQTSYRWAERRAVLRVPLDHTAGLRVEVRLHAFAYPGAPPQTITIAANSGACAPLLVPPRWQTVECTLDAPAWRTGVNRVALTFNYASRPVDVGLGGDTRPLSAAVDWLRVRVTSPDTAR
jgi:hypothetical protein